jgi:beta-lactamase superfamily II metal-dependent hydrolase
VSRNAPLVVGLVSGSHVVNHAYLLLFAPAFPLLSADFSVTLGQLGLAVGLVNAVVTVGQLPLGYVSDSYSHAAVLVGSLAVGTLGCALAALATSYELLLAAAVVMGLGIAGHHPAHYPLISAAAPDAYRSRAYSAHGFAGALGLALPFAVVPAAVALGFGWQAAFGSIAVIGAVYTVFTVLVVRRLPHSLTRAGAEARDEDESLVDALRAVDTVSARLRLLAGRAAAYFRTIAGAPLILLLTALWFVNSAAIWGVRAYAATLLDVGYGHASVVETASGRVLVDAGPTGRVLDGVLAPAGADAEDRLVLTRDRAGHRGGIAVLAKHPIANTHDALDPQGACARGAAWDSGGVRFRFLDRELGVPGCVLLVTTDRHRWLFATGMEPDDRPAWHEAPAVDGVVLPAGGHRDAVSRAMLSALQPRIAIVPVDADNRYGLPHPETLARLRRHGAAVAVTGTAGAITAVLGDKLEIVRARGRAGWWNRRPGGRPFGPGGESFIMQPSRGGPEARAAAHRDKGEDRRGGLDRSGRLGDGSHHSLLGPSAGTHW